MAHPSQPFFQDGDFSTPVRISRTPRHYPFAQNGDLATAEYDATYVVEAQSFTPTARGTEDPENAGFYLIAETRPEIFQGNLATFRRTYCKIPAQQVVPSSQFITKPEIPGDFPQEFGDGLVLKPDPTVGRYEFYTKTAVQTDVGAATAVYPTGGTYDVTFDGDTASGVAYDAAAATLQTALNALASITAYGGVTVTGEYNSATGFVIAPNSYGTATADLSSLTATASGFMASDNLGWSRGFRQRITLKASWYDPAVDFTGGTFTLTLFGQTTAAIAYNATAATVEAALNALSEVSDRGGCTVTIPGGGATILQASGGVINFLIEFAWPTLSVDFSSLTPAGSTAFVTSDPAGASTYPRTVITFAGGATGRSIVTASAHGIEDGDTIYLKAGDEYYDGITDGFSVTSPTSIALDHDVGAALTVADTISEVGRKTTATYTAGVKLTRVNYVTDFYLPGVSSGITTAADIPLPDYDGDDASLIAAILAGSTEINFEVGALQQWRDSPILMRTTTQLNASQL